jgi:uncharacterized protein (DUF1684 family)
MLGCKEKLVVPENPTWRDAVEAFQRQRAEEIGGPDGWITLVGRFPLEEGPNEVGSKSGAVAELAANRSPPLLGTVFIEPTGARFVAAPGVDVRVAGQPVTEVAMADDAQGQPTVLQHESLRLHVIQRAGSWYLRVKDREHPARQEFAGLHWYPIDSAWRVHGQFTPAPTGATVPIENVLHQTAAQPSPGTVSFVINGTRQTLVALYEGGPGLFLIFKDQTNIHETYPAGRFLDTDAPGPDGSVELDFNRAYTPPCAFTAFATCPLPPSREPAEARHHCGRKRSRAPR